MSQKKEIRAYSSNGAKSYHGFYQELDGSIEMHGSVTSGCSQEQFKAHKKAYLYLERGEIEKAVEILESCFEKVFSPLQTRSERYKKKNGLSSIHIFKEDKEFLNRFKKESGIASDQEAIRYILTNHGIYGRCREIGSNS